MEPPEDSMILKKVLQYTSLFIIVFLPPFRQSIAEVDVPELRLLASKLKPEECVKIVTLDSQPLQSKSKVKRLTGEEDCFQRLVQWICRLKTVTKNTYPIVVDRLKDIGRKDLIAYLSSSKVKNSMSSKVIREVQSFDDSEDYDGITTLPDLKTSNKKKHIKREKDNSTKATSFFNKTIEKINGFAFVKIPLKAAGIILLTTVLITCCCTLFVRSKLAKLCNKLRGKKKQSKFLLVDTEGERNASRTFPLKRSHKKRKRAPSYDMVHTGTQNSIHVVPREPEELPPTGCYRCYKKKRKKSSKRPKR